MEMTLWMQLHLSFYNEPMLNLKRKLTDVTISLDKLAVFSICSNMQEV